VLTWTAVVLPSRGLSSHRLCAHLTVKPYARVISGSSTAAKYSSGTVPGRSAEVTNAALTCSTSVFDSLARGSGRRGPEHQTSSATTSPWVEPEAHRLRRADRSARFTDSAVSMQTGTPLTRYDRISNSSWTTTGPAA